MIWCNPVSEYDKEPTLHIWNDNSDNKSRVSLTY